MLLILFSTDSYNDLKDVLFEFCALDRQNCSYLWSERKITSLYLDIL